MCPVNKNQTLTMSEDHVYRLSPSGAMVPGVSEIISSVFPFMGQGPAVERACQFGDAVHALVEMEINGTLDPASVDPALHPYGEQVWRFLSEYDIKKENCKTEVMLYSKKYNFAGRVDIVSDKYCIDIKSGQKSPTHRLQVAAYRHLVNCNQKEKIKESLIVYLDGSDKFPIIVKEKKEDFGVFLSCLNIFQFKGGSKS